MRSVAHIGAAVALAAAACGRAPVPADCGTPCALECGAGVDRPALEGAQHVPEGTQVTWVANPPASGPHFPTWDGNWGIYTDPLPRGTWLHNLEHGGIVLSYSCPGGCPAEVAQLTQLRAGRAPDRYGKVRVILTPDPLMPRRFAALAWGYRWQGDAVDLKAIGCFIDARYDHAPESTP